MGHRVLMSDVEGGVHCFVCGAYADSDEALRAVECVYDNPHPPYVLGIADDRPVIETCAAHPYAGCDPVLATV